jgi:hypothetical protein
MPGIVQHRLAAGRIEDCHRFPKNVDRLFVDHRANMCPPKLTQRQVGASAGA